MGRCWFAILVIAAHAVVPLQAVAQATISWSANARAYRGMEPVTVRCPPGGRAGAVWGSDTYTDDSSICTAAVHAGVITFEAGGTVLLEMRPGRTSYAGTRRNGVASQSWEEWESSFAVSLYVEPQPEPPKPPPPPPVIPWDRTAEGLAPNGRRFTFRCRPPATRVRVIGVDLYSWESSICAAAVHAGAIAAERGGTVTIEMRLGADRYAGSERNGVMSEAGASSLLGFVFIKDGTSR